MDQETAVILKQALFQLQQYREAEKRTTEPLAIVGMSARFPGSNNLSDFWQQLLNGTDSIQTVPASRWNVDDYYDPKQDTPGKTYTREGAFITDIDLFDAAFFGISPVEALAMDPQQRLMLELTWRAFEDAGYLPAANPDTGVFIGVSNTEYASLLSTAETDPRTLPYFSTGNVLNAIPGRLSYQFDFHGPCLAVDTACSSSLVALHLACKSIRNGECRQAVVGGVNLQLLPQNTIAVSQTKMLAPDGRCKTFDASANGYSRGEGCGVVIIKRLSDALHDNNTIQALLMSTAMNHNGNGSGFTVPDSLTQQQLMQTAVEAANIDAASISYLEAHGTGTALGDPIEWAAIAAVYGNAPGRETPLWTSTVKTNIGHLEAAAGIAGLIKTVLAMKRGIIPAHLHFRQLNPHISAAGTLMSIPVVQQEWRVTQGPRRAAVSSFGFSGTNAHAILEEAPSPQQPDNDDSLADLPALLTIAAHTPVALRILLEEYLQRLQQPQEVSLPVFCQAAQRINTDREYRKAFVAEDYGSLAAQLKQHLSQDITVAPHPGKQPLLVLTGYDSDSLPQYQALYHTLPAFKLLADQYLPLQQLEETAVLTRSTAFLLEYCLVRLLLSWGIKVQRIYVVNEGLYTAAAISGIVTPENVLAMLAAKESAGKLTAFMPQQAKVAIFQGERDVTVNMQQFSFWESLPLYGVDESIHVTDDAVWAGIGRHYAITGGNGHRVTSAAALLYFIAACYENGSTPEWNSFYEHIPVATLEQMPVYPFQYSSYWPGISQKKLPELPVYDKRWEPLTLPALASTLPKQYWVVLGGHMPDNVIHTLSDQGITFIQLYTITGNDDTLLFSTDKNHGSALKDVLGELNRVDGLIDTTLLDVAVETDLYQQAEAATLYLQKLSVQLQDVHIPKLKIVLCTAEDNMLAEVSSAVWRVMGQELPLFRWQHVYLPSAAGVLQWQLCFRSILNTNIPAVRINDTGCLQPVCVSVALPSTNTVSSQSLFDPEAAYLITGANGAIGQQLVQWITMQGARHLVLASRKGFATPAQHDFLETLRQQGVFIAEYHADLSAEDQVNTLLQSFGTAFVPELKGVFHIAGITDDELLYQQSPQRLQAVMSAKAASLWYLHKYSLSLKLDHFVAFSSSSSHLGFSGQGAYAAANAFMNALIGQRRQQALPGMSICWGPWNIGMTAQMPPAYKSLLASYGVEFIEAAAALDIMERLLKQEMTPVPIVIAADVQALNKALLTNGITNQATNEKVVKVMPEFADTQEAQRWMQQYLRKKLEEVAGIPSAQISTDVPLVSQGMDSLMAVRIQQEVAAATGCMMHMADLLQGGTLRTLTTSLCRQLEQPRQTISSAVNISAAEVETLGDDQVDTLLKAMLGQ